MSVRRSRKELSIWTSRLSKEDHSHQCGWASSNQLRAWIEQKGRKRVNLLSLCSSWDIHLGPGLHPRPLILSLRTWITPLAFLVLQLAGCRSKDFSASITAWDNPYNKAPLIYTYIYILLVLFLWRTLTDTPSYKLLSSYLNKKEMGGVGRRVGGMMLKRKKNATSRGLRSCVWGRGLGCKMKWAPCCRRATRVLRLKDK